MAVEGNTPAFYMFAYRFKQARRHLATHSKPTDKRAERKSRRWLISNGSI